MSGDVIAPVPVPEPTEAEIMRALDGKRLPVTTLAEAIPHLRRPFTPEAIRFKVQSVFKGKEGQPPSGCLIVAYIDARLASERLNRVIPGGWHAEYKMIDGSQMMWCRLTVDGVARTDVGASTKGMSKDLVSDALKRAAVQFGVGVSCYALPEIKIFMRDSRDRIKVQQTSKGPTILLTEYGHETLRAGYDKWLTEHGIDRFGPPLDHGDVVGSTIEEDAQEIGAGEGDGSAPGWQLAEGVGQEWPQQVEAMIQMAETFGVSLDLASLQMRLNGQKAEAFEAWLGDTQDMLAKRQESEGGGDE